MTVSFDDFHQVLGQVARDFGSDSKIAEAELVNRWFMAGVFSELGYGSHRDDYRVERKIQGAGRADVVLRSFAQRARAVIEFKRPLTPLDDHVKQVREYADRLLPDVAILTNGKDLWLYGRQGPLPLDPLRAEPSRYDLTALTPTDARILFDQLRKLEVDISNLEALTGALDDLQARPVRVEGPQSPGGVAFLERFGLDKQSVFGRLVSVLFDALPVLQYTSQFTDGAYAFWDRAYARELSSDDAPKTWGSVLRDRTGKEEVRRFMFCLESGYAVLARALLAKAMQDAGFPNMDVIGAFRRSAENRQSQGRLSPEDYFPLLVEVFDHAGRQAFQSLFASDIFDWWQDAGLLPDARPLAEALSEVVFAVFGFDFASLEGDVLGELYQDYFDRETRLALGEFYTPREVVEFILDEVGYVGEATDRGRLLDPACGSGTFLVAALQRYLEAHEDEDGRRVLTRLILGLHIVGLDVNPFATLLAQVNYAAQLLPLYSEVLQKGPFSIQNLPVYRTDSLRFERREAETEKAATSAARPNRRGRSAPLPGSVGFRFTYAGDMAVIRQRLPVRAPEGGFVEVHLPVPRADLARERRLVDNLEQYAIALSALFDAVDAGEDQALLANRLNRNGMPRPSELAAFMAPALSGVRDTIDRLRSEYDDGRFQKTLRDLAVAVVVKNELEYEFVVGNPPYVRVQRLPEELRGYWTGQYSWTHGNFDIYMPFIERAVTDWLREGGLLGFICSDRFLLANYAEQLRASLPDVATPELILDLRDTRVFRGALNYPAIFVFRRGTADDGEFLAGRAFADPGEPAAFMTDARTTLDAARAAGGYQRGEYVDGFRMPLGELTDHGWYLMPRAERRVFDVLKSAGTHRLEELTGTESGGFAGYQTSADEVMVLRLVEDRGDRVLLAPKGGNATVEIEKAAVRPWLFGHDVERWYIDWDGWYVLFPYVKVEGQHKLAPSREHAEDSRYSGRIPFVEDAWPGFWGYVTRPPVRRVLQAREGGKFGRGRPSSHLWYGPSYPRSIDLYEQPKLVVQISSTRADIGVDETGYVFQAGGRGGGVYGLSFADGSAERLSYVCAVLNSRPMDFVLKHSSTVYSGKAYSYSDSFIKDLPIVVPRDRREQAITSRLGNLADSLSDIKSEWRSVSRACATFPATQSEALPSEIDRYPLERLADGTPSAKTLRRDELQWETQLDGRPSLRSGRAVVVLPSAAHAAVARAWLEAQPRNTIASPDLLALRLPETEAGCSLLLDALERDRSRAADLSRQIEDHELEVDELVMELYGLAGDTDARAVIEDFLGRF